MHIHVYIIAYWVAKAPINQLRLPHCQTWQGIFYTLPAGFLISSFSETIKMAFDYQTWRIPPISSIVCGPKTDKTMNNIHYIHSTAPNTS